MGERVWVDGEVGEGEGGRVRQPWKGERRRERKGEGRTLSLNPARSAGVSVSALATIGIRFTRVPRRFMISMSRGLSLCRARGMISMRAGYRNAGGREGRDGRVAGWPNEVEARVHAHVDLVASLGLLLLAHEGLVLVILQGSKENGVSSGPPVLRPRGRDRAHDEVNDGHPRVAVVDVVSEAGGVDHGELDLELLLLELGFDDVCCSRGRGRKRVSFENEDAGCDLSTWPLARIPIRSRSRRPGTLSRLLHPSPVLIPPSK